MPDDVMPAEEQAFREWLVDECQLDPAKLDEVYNAHQMFTDITARYSREALKLYVWPDALCDYTCGVIFALASSPDEARRLVRADEGGDLPSVLGELGKEPDVYDSPVGFHVWGGG